MRNLKKILALVLALIMSLSLMATAGAGSFQDVTDDNPYKTAIDVLDELKVFQGFEDGTFKPTDTLTRAQAAVLVYRIATGDVENKYLDNYTYMQQSKFTDLDGYNWAKGYINYCQNAGIVVGTDATHFNPGGQVTGYQLLVMLLRTLGYGKAGEFTDPKGWELQTASIAEREGILKNVTGGDFEHAAPRQMVAEILFRGILHDTVEYSPLTPGGYTNSGVSLGKKTLNLDDIEGVVVANRIADLYDTEPMKDGQTRMIVDGKDYVIDMDTDATAIGLNHHAYVQNGKVLGGSLEADGNVIGEPEHGEAAKVADLAKAAGIKVTGDTEHYLNFDKNIREYSEWRLEYNVEFDSTNPNNPDPKGWFESKTGVDLNTYFAGVDSKLKEVTPNESYTLIIPRGDKIKSEDIAIMKGIFSYADDDTDKSLGITGYVYAGSNSNAEVKRNLDLSDTMTWTKFYNEYILGDDTEIKDSDNGEWLRVIDNDGDGEVDYVLRTDFIMTTVVDYEKRTDLYNVEYDVDGNGAVGKAPNNVISKIPAGEIRKDDDVDMSVGAVILYTYIDGYYYVSNPEVQVLTVDKKSIDQKKNTFTADDAPYTWSGIDEEAERYYDDVSELNYDVAYMMYFDHFGYVRLATENIRNFVLLTDAYFGTDYRSYEQKVELWNGEEKEESPDAIDAARDNGNSTRKVGYDGKEDGFVDTYEDDHQGNRGTWRRLNTFGEFYAQNDVVDTMNHWHYTDKVEPADDDGTHTYYADPFYTNIALGTKNDDGVWTLQDVTDIDTVYNTLKRTYNVYELAGTSARNVKDSNKIDESTLKAANHNLWGINGYDYDTTTSGWNGAAIDESELQAIQTNNLTLYYLVKNPSDYTKREVISWVGADNTPEAYKSFVPAYAYAVTHDSGANAGYQIADVVVLEAPKATTTTPPQLVVTGINPKSVWTLGKDMNEDDTPYTAHRENWPIFDDSENLLKSHNYGKTDGLYAPQLSFYVDEGDGDGYVQIPADSNKHSYADYNIYAGIVSVAPGTKADGNYIQVTKDGVVNDNDRIEVLTKDFDTIAFYEIMQNTKKDYEAAHNLSAIETENIHEGDKVIVVSEGSRSDVKMIINVSASGKNGDPWYSRTTGAETPANKIQNLATLWKNVNDEWTDETVGKLPIEIVVKKGVAEVLDAAAEVAGNDVSKVDDVYYITNNAKESALTFSVDEKYTVSGATIVANDDGDTNGTLTGSGATYMLTGLDKDNGTVKIELTVTDTTYEIKDVWNATTNASISSDAKVNGTAWDTATKAIAVGTADTKVTFTVTGKVPTKVELVNNDDATVKQTLTFTKTATPDEYEVSFTMPAYDVKVVVTTANGYTLSLDPASDTVEFDTDTATAAETAIATSAKLNAVGKTSGGNQVITVVPKTPGETVDDDSIVITMGGVEVAKNLYTVSSGTITWAAGAANVDVTGDIVVSAEAAVLTRDVTIQISTGVATIKSVVDEDNNVLTGTDGVYTVAQSKDVTVTVTVTSADAQRYGIAVADGDGADVAATQVGATYDYTFEITGDTTDETVTVEQIVKIVLASSTGVTGTALTATPGDAVPGEDGTYLVADHSTITVAGGIIATGATVTATPGKAGGAPVSKDIAATSISAFNITVDGSDTWTFTAVGP